MRQWPTAVGAMTSIALLMSLSVACSDSGSSSPTSAGTDTSVGDTVDSSSPSSTGAGDTTLPPSGELTASWTGVTESTIKFGLAGIDPDAVRSFGIEFDGPSSQQLMNAWIDVQNKKGGVLGRSIELAFTPYLPISDAQAEAACVALTEDEKVFAATGILLGDTSLCFTETHNTPYIGIFGQSAARNARAQAPFLAIEMADDAQRSAGVQTFIDQGLLDGKKVALYTEAQDRIVTDNVIKPLLAAAGVDVVVSESLDDFGDDTAAQDQALDTIVEKMRSSNVDVVLNVSNFTSLMLAFQRKGWSPESILATSAQAVSADFVKGSGIDPGSMVNVTVAAPYIPTKDELLADALVVACIDEYNASGQEPLIDVAESTAASLNSVASQCAAFRLFVDTATAAGVDLNPTTFGAAADSMGVVALPGVPYGSLGPNKRFVGDAIGVYTFDPATEMMVPTGPAIQVG